MPVITTKDGVDLFFKGQLGSGLTMRTIMSFLVARRTAATIGTLSSAPFDVTWSRAIIAEKAFANGVRAGLTYRASTGRPTHRSPPQTTISRAMCTSRGTACL